MGQATRALQIVFSIAVFCVLAAAATRPTGAEEAVAVPPGGEDAAPAVAADLTGRWEGRSFVLSRRGSDCSGTRCMLTLDISRCGSGWCGVEVLDTERRCGATALKLDAGAGGGGASTVFKGSLELAKETEPYVVEVYLLAPGGEEPRREIEIAGDTGGEFRMFRRSFPFNATLARSGEAVCRPESTVSLLD